MLIPDILGRVVIRVEAVPTFTAEEERLRATIIAGLMPTARARLGGVARVNLDHLDPSCLGFVLDKRVQLGKAPAMQASLVINVLVLFASAHLGRFPDVGQVLKDDGTARSGVLNNALTEDVIVIFALAKQFSTQLTEMSLSRFGAFALQFSLDTEDAPFLFFPSAVTQELTTRRNGWAIESQVNPDHLIRGSNSRFRNGYYDMEGKTSLTVAQVSTTDFMPNVLHEVSRNGEGQFNSPIYGSKATGECMPLDPVRTLVIADTRKFAMWALDRLKHRNGFPLLLGLFLFDLPGKRTLDRLSGLDTSSTHQLSWQLRILSTQIIVGLLMQVYPVATLASKAKTRDDIEARRMLLKRLAETSRLFWRGFSCTLRENKAIPMVLRASGPPTAVAVRALSAWQREVGIARTLVNSSTLGASISVLSFMVKEVDILMPVCARSE